MNELNNLFTIKLNKMEMYLAKLLWNNKNWTQVSDCKKSSSIKNCGLLGKKNDGKVYNWGFEEWLNHETLRERKIGYLECYHRGINQPNKKVNILLFSKDFEDTEHGQPIYHVGTIYGVQKLEANDFPLIRKDYLGDSFLEKVKKHFEDIKDTNSFELYENSFSSHKIEGTLSDNLDSENQSNAAFNIKYDEIIFYNKNERKNLSKDFPDFGKKFRKLGKRFNSSAYSGGENDTEFKKYIEEKNKKS